MSLQPLSHHHSHLLHSSKERGKKTEQRTYFKCNSPTAPVNLNFIPLRHNHVHPPTEREECGCVTWKPKKLCLLCVTRYEPWDIVTLLFNGFMLLRFSDVRLVSDLWCLPSTRPTQFNYSSFCTNSRRFRQNNLYNISHQVCFIINEPTSRSNTPLQSLQSD